METLRATIKDRFSPAKFLTKNTWQKYLLYDFYDNKNTQSQKAPGAPDCLHFISHHKSETRERRGDYIASFLIINGEGNSCLNAVDYILIITVTQFLFKHA